MSATPRSFSPRLVERLPYRAFVDFDEPEPAEEFDDDDIEDDDEDRNILTDVIGLK